MLKISKNCIKMHILDLKKFIILNYYIAFFFKFILFQIAYSNCFFTIENNF